MVIFHCHVIFFLGGVTAVDHREWLAPLFYNIFQAISFPSQRIRTEKYLKNKRQHPSPPTKTILNLPDPYHFSLPVFCDQGMGHVEVVRCLLDALDALSTVDARDALGATALWAAARNGRVQVTELLLEKKAQQDLLLD